MAACRSVRSRTRRAAPLWRRSPAVLDERKCSRAPRLDPDLIAVLEVPHVELAGGRSAEGSVRNAVDHHAARSADALAAVVLEVNGLFALSAELFVDHVEHLQERS